ncbi:O-antigen ligase family protein [Thermodesulfobacteriota bacterium]
MFFSFIILFWKYKKMMFVAMVLTLLLLGFFITNLRSPLNPSANKDRLTINYISWLVIKDNPLKGLGFGIETFGNPKFIDHEYYRGQVPKEILHSSVHITSPHNMWMGITIRTGVVGLLLFISICFAAARMYWRIMRHYPDEEWCCEWTSCGAAILVAVAVYGIFNVVFMHFIEMLIWLSLAIVAICYNELFRKKEDLCLVQE